MSRQSRVAAGRGGEADPVSASAGSMFAATMRNFTLHAPSVGGRRGAARKPHLTALTCLKTSRSPQT
jgi:hypothetical protein